MSSPSSFGKFLVGALVGGAVGAVVGMLLAPRSGVETREMLRDELNNRYDDLNEKYKGSVEGLRDKADVVREKASAIKDKIKTVADDLEEAGRRTVSRFKEGKGAPPETN